ncbi:hypothetical protein EDC04DRAFT_1460764 [Pisolithus marmoratus]|nr:hypothetical protein EDC04DRAFT_1460764 [Pisolithus marmoratus]
MLVIDGVDEEGISVESHRVSQVPVTPGEPPQHHGQEEYSDIGALLRTMAPQELEKKSGRDNLRRWIGNLFQYEVTTIHLRKVSTLFHLVTTSHLHYRYPNISGRTLNPSHSYLTTPLNFKVHRLTIVLSIILDEPSLVCTRMLSCVQPIEVSKSIWKKRGYAAATGRSQVRALHLSRSRHWLSKYVNVTMMSSRMWMPSGGTKSDADGLRFQALKKPCGRCRKVTILYMFC